MPPENCPLENCPTENCPQRKFPSRKLTPGKLPPGKLSPWNYFVNFLSLVFIFMRIFVHKKNVFSLNEFFCYKFVYSIRLHYFFLCVYFWFSGMAYNAYHTYTRAKNGGHRYLATRFFRKQHFFSTQPQCCLTFS